MKLSGKFITVPLARKIVGLPGHAASGYNRCVGREMKLMGKPGSQKGVLENFMKAVSTCKNGGWKKS